MKPYKHTYSMCIFFFFTAVNIDDTQSALPM